MKETVLDSDFLILNRIPTLYSVRRFQEEFAQQNLNGTLITPEQLETLMPQLKTQGFYPALLYRQGDYRFWETHTTILKYPGTIINHPAEFLRARDKWQAYQLCLRAGLPMPKTFLASEMFVKNRESLSEMFQDIHTQIGLPFILKKRMSSQGRGVFKIETFSEWEKLLKFDAIELQSNFSRTNNGPDPSLVTLLDRWLVQECIHECLGSDVRSFQVNDKQFAIIRSNPDSFLSNLHRGGKPQRTELSPTEKEIVLKAHALSNLHYSGVDFLRSSRGPLLLEINPSPGFEGIEQVNSVNIASEILAMFTA